jgi:hypothetical protein
MTFVFKHMTRENAEKLTHGEIRIGSFAYYHDTEHQASIQDKNEGLTLGYTDEKTILTSNENKGVETTIAGLKFVTGSGGLIDVSNVKFVRLLPPLYIYSTSFVGTVGHFEGYDTVIRINDIEAFGKIIVDRRLDLFHGYHANRIQYQPRVYNALNHQGIEPDPFIKEEKFSPDEEFRIVFIPVAKVEKQLTFSLIEIQQAYKNGLFELI